MVSDKARQFFMETFGDNIYRNTLDSETKYTPEELEVYWIDSVIQRLQWTEERNKRLLNDIRKVLGPLVDWVQDDA